MNSRWIVLAAAATILCGCSGAPALPDSSPALHQKLRHTGKTPSRTQSIPSTATAKALAGPQQDIQTLLTGPAKSLPVDPNAGGYFYLHGHGLLVQVWPSGPSPDGHVCGVYFNMTIGLMGVVFRGVAAGGSVRTSEETSAVRFVPLTDETLTEYVTRPHFAARVRDAMRGTLVPAESFEVRPYSLTERIDA